MRFKQREIIDRNEIDEILSKALVGRIGLASNTLPYVVPVHFAYDKGKIYFHTAGEGKKIEYLKTNPKVCFEVDELQRIVADPSPCNFDTKYRSVIAFGTARIVTDKEQRLQALHKILAKHGGDETSLTLEMIDKYLSVIGTKVAIIEIQIDQLTGKKA